MSDARVLAELIVEKCGWQSTSATDGFFVYQEGFLKDGFLADKLDTDLNAMREVWKVLKERGLWMKFERAYANSTTPWPLIPLYDFLNDLPGQVKAAIKVFKEAQG